MKVELFAPASFWTLDEDEVKQLRCGPGRGVLELLVPETIYGLRITPACAVHDFMYRLGGTDKDKCEADDVFLNNMIRIIEVHTKNKILLFLRLRRAQVYYQFVRNFGGPAFWKDKNKQVEMGFV